jgi:phosphatidylglycerol:prolipoprotein diacylglycerol transferase
MRQEAPVLIFPNINPYAPLLGPYEFSLGAWHIGPLGVRWYALAYIAGIVLGWRYCVRLVRTPALWGAREPTASPTQIDDLVLWLTLGVVIGGRLGSMLFYNTHVLFTHPAEIFKIWNGGMSFHGGLIGVTIAILLFARANRIDILRLADLVAPCAPFGLFFGRIANFINGELWGRVTHVPWGMVFCNQTILSAYGQCPAGLEPRHPSQLYEATLEGVVLFLVLRWATHRAKWLQRQGAITGLFMICYALFRISLENVRQPDEGMPNFPLGLTMGMILSIPMMIFGAWLVVRALRRPLEPSPAE